MMEVATTGEKLNRLRRSRGLTQVELSERSGVAQSTITHIESGKHQRPHPSTLIKLSRALGVTPADLLED